MSGDAMKSRINRFLSFILVAFLFTALTVSGSEGFQTQPVLNKGRKWRIAYYEGGPYLDYYFTLKSTVNNLVKLGWIREINFPEDRDLSEKKLWNYLAHNVKSEYLEFLSDYFLSANWDKVQRAKNKSRMIELFNTPNKIDMVFALGTWAGQDLANNLHSIPVVVMSTSDPVKANIIKSPDDSGYDHVFARCDPNRFIRQLNLFHRIVGFKKLGMIYEDSETGRAISYIEEAKQVGRERHFDIISCHIHNSGISKEVMVNEYLACLNTVAPEIDAFLLTAANASQSKYVQKYIPVLLQYEIPSWSIVQDLSLVEGGIMMSLSKKNFDNVGMFHATAIARILHGEKPRSLNQIFEDIDTIAINMKTAERIGFDLPKGIVNIAEIKFFSFD